MPKVYVITQETEDELLYWSNEDGWGDADSATEFTETERKDCTLPIAGEWVERILC